MGPPVVEVWTDGVSGVCVVGSTVMLVFQTHGYQTRNPFWAQAPLFLGSAIRASRVETKEGKPLTSLRKFGQIMSILDVIYSWSGTRKA